MLNLSQIQQAYPPHLHSFSSLDVSLFLFNPNDVQRIHLFEQFVQQNLF